MNIPTALAEAKKALAALGTLESAAVAIGVLNGQQQGWITAALGALTSAVVYFASNVPKGATANVDMGIGKGDVLAGGPPSPNAAVN